MRVPGTHPSASSSRTAGPTDARIHNSHNGCNLGNAFVREQVREIGRYRVIAPNGLKCRAGIDVESAVVETFSPGTVLQVSQVCRPTHSLRYTGIPEGLFILTAHIDRIEADYYGYFTHRD